MATRKLTVRNPEAFAARQRKASAAGKLARFGTPTQRFWISTLTSDDGCWRWLGLVTSNGYGRLSINSRQVRAHRFSWELANGPIPRGQMVLHRCDNKKCVRPDHLFLGTQADNMQDAKDKGIAYRPGQHNTQGANGRWMKKK